MRTLTAGFLTTINFQMARIALSFLLFPWKWFHLRTGNSTHILEQSLAKLLHTERTYSFYNGRSALYHSLKLLKIGKGDEVIIQAYTCVSVPNAIIQTGATPIYSDIIANSLNIDPQSIEQKISSKTKAVIIQHTFGFPADISNIREICHQHQIPLIEDCAHALGAKYHEQLLGTFGDLAIFSFGRDKVISCVSAGFLVINNPQLNKEFIHKLKPLPFSLTIKSLIYIPLSWLARVTYDFLSLGKVIIYLSRRLHLFPEVLTCSEKNCTDRNFHYSLPNSLAAVGISELHKLNDYQKHRQRISEFYYSHLPEFSRQVSPNDSSPAFLRHTLFTPDSARLMAYCQKYRVILGDWYRQPIAPAGVDFHTAHYRQGSCPQAEKQASQSINLPNHSGISLHDAKRVVTIIKQFSQK